MVSKIEACEEAYAFLFGNWLSLFAECEMLREENATLKESCRQKQALIEYMAQEKED